MKHDPSAEDTPAFEFGRNWQRFLECVNDERVRIATESLTGFLGVDDLAGRTFLDVGCGSGLFSYAAHRLGADEVVSFDVDPFSVACCRHWHEQAGGPASWRVLEGSILDPAFVGSLPGAPYDVVYAWGVLHHTGCMWEAIESAAGLVAPGGAYYLSIYNRKRGLRGSKPWLRIKRFYNRRSPAGRRLMERLYAFYWLQSKVLRFKNPRRLIREYRAKRGMDWRTDLVDWLGGYPYEFATVQEVFDFVRRTDPAFSLVNLKATDGLGTNSFLFRRVAPASPVSSAARGEPASGRRGS